MSNYQLSFISLTDLMMHNMENVTSAGYSLLYFDEAMNDIISLIILNNYTVYTNHHILSHIKVSYDICGKQLKYLNMYLSRLHNIMHEIRLHSGWGMTAQACANMPQASNT